MGQRQPTADTIELWPKVAHLRRDAASLCEAVKADDGVRTRDLRLGKPTLYQLSYVRKCAEMLAIGTCDPNATRVRLDRRKPWDPGWFATNRRGGIR